MPTLPVMNCKISQVKLLIQDCYDILHYSAAYLAFYLIFIRSGGKYTFLKIETFTSDSNPIKLDVFRCVC